MTQPEARTPLRILVVEDEYYIADELRRALLHRGAEIVGPTPSVEGALDLLADPGVVNAAVLDISVQDGAVWPLARALRDRGAPFVFATGYSDAVVPAEFQDVPLFRKPVELPNLITAVLSSGEGGR